MKQIYLAGIVLLITMHAHSQTNTFDGSTSNNWNTGSNWSLNIVPTSSHDAVIPNGFDVVVNTSTAVCNTLTIGGGGSDNSIIIATGNALSVTGALTINAGTGNNDDKIIYMTGGSLTCSSLTMAATGDDTRDCEIDFFTGGTVTVNGSITMNGTTARNAIRFTSAGTLNVGGDFNSGGDLVIITGSNVNYTGASAQIVRAAAYSNIGFSGGGQKNLAGAASVSGTATFTNGLVNTTSTNLLSILNNATVASVNNNSFVQGPVRKVGNDAFVFPVGAIGASYHPVSISAPGNVTDQFTAEYVRASGAALGAITVVGLYGVSNCEYWRLNRNVGTSNVNVTLSWTATSPCGGSYITSLIGLQVSAFNGTNWNTSAGNGSSGTTTAGTVVRNAVSVFGNGTTTFSSFAIGNVNAAGSPLPVVYGNIKAFTKSNGVQLEWEVLSESEVDHYSIERSTDGRQFTSIGQQQPLLNNSGRIVYNFFDASAAAGVYYYRIKSIESTGKIRYTIIVKVDTRKGQTLITLYPNPVSGQSISLQATDLPKGKYSINIYNAMGQSISTQVLSHNGGSVTTAIALPASIKAGNYHLVINGDMLNTARTFIVQ